jgi:hypothetical protein
MTASAPSAKDSLDISRLHTKIGNVKAAKRHPHRPPRASLTGKR